MYQTTKTSCEREADLMSFLYGEASEQETRDFERHLKLCVQCRSELSSFGQMRVSIGSWKSQALAGFSSSQVVAPLKKKSALGALREFFDLSPLWMKGAVAFATLLFCAMAVLLLARVGTQPTQSQAATDDKYTKEQVNGIVADALKKQASELASAQSGPKEPNVVVKTSDSGSRPVTHNKSTQWARRSRPLSKSEREQLAADLRLLSTKDEDTLNLLGDRINQEF